MVFSSSQNYAKALRLKLIGGALPVMFALAVLYRFNHIPALILSVGIFAVLPVVWSFYIPLHVSRLQVKASKGRLIIKRGVIIKYRHVLPLCRTVYCKICDGPIYRLLGLSTVKIRLVGSEIAIRGLDRKDAEKLAAWLEEEK